jgi:hypothetical protein
MAAEQVRGNKRSALLRFGLSGVVFRSVCLASIHLHGPSTVSLDDALALQVMIPKGVASHIRNGKAEPGLSQQSGAVFLEPVAASPLCDREGAESKPCRRWVSARSPKQADNGENRGRCSGFRKRGCCLPYLIDQRRCDELIGTEQLDELCGICGVMIRRQGWINAADRRGEAP